MRSEIRKLQRRLGKTAIYVTHDQGEALALSDRIVVMSRGRIEQIGTPREVYETPRTRFVADFIGASNLLAGVVEPSGAAGTTVRLVGARLTSSDTAAPGPVTVLIRPERIRLVAADTAPAGGNVLAARVAEVVYLGEDLQLTLEVAGGMSLAVSLKATVAEKELAPGTAVGAVIAHEDVRLLPSPEAGGA
jgi:ABC-type Fe3+/spermidine/putrescine transport system ATPase subunit